jgi:NADH dehydrogenase FAD-containing subunit
LSVVAPVAWHWPAVWDGWHGARQLDITLVDASRTHIWKPLLHEIAAGSMNPHREALDYLAQAKRDGFRFCLGRMTGLNRQQQTIQLAATADEQGQPLIPASSWTTTFLVMAIGSTTNDFAHPAWPNMPSASTPRTMPAVFTANW